MSHLKLVSAMIMLQVFSILLLASATLAEVSEDEAASVLTKAEESVASTFNAVRNAERAGANVSMLLTRLNEAQGALTEGKVAYSLRYFDEATRSANLCLEISSSVMTQAEELTVEASGKQLADNFMRIAGSIIGIIVIGVSSFLGWRTFKKHYYKKVLEMKPEVNSDES